MRTLSAILLLLSCCATASAQNNPKYNEEVRNIPAGTTRFKWDTTYHDFGEIQKDQPVSVIYAFTNAGKIPLLILNVTPTCGCTATEYTQTAIPPGEKGSVKITFDAAKKGPFNKTIVVFANTDPQQAVLTFSGEVR